MTVDTSTVVQWADTQLGTPYKMGSAAGRTAWDAGKQVLFDCSGLVAWAYFQATGVKLPAYTDALASDPRLTEVSTPNIGDVVLFKFYDAGQPKAAFPHAALYAGNGMVVESGSADASRSKVNYMPLLNTLNPHFYRLKENVVTNPPVVGPVPIPPNGQIPIPGIGQSPAPTPGNAIVPSQGSVTATLPPTGTGAGQIGPFPISIPTGLIIALLGIFLLLLGALLFSSQARGAAMSAVTSPAEPGSRAWMEGR